jgi:energy-converting hydrogenase Eha subunit C
MVASSPKEIMGLGFTISGAVLIVMGLLTLGLSIVTSATGVTVIDVNVSILASVVLIAIGLIFCWASFYYLQTAVGKSKR